MVADVIKVVMVIAITVTADVVAIEVIALSVQQQ
jgi:hypothetical protein